MKRNLKVIALGVITLLSTVLSAHAEVKPYKELSNKEVIEKHSNIAAYENIEYNKLLFTNDFEYSNLANNSKFDKKTYVKYMTSLKGIKYDATQTIEIIDQTDNSTIGKVTQSFENFTRVDYMTLIQSKDGWKISKIITTYK